MPSGDANVLFPLLWLALGIGWAPVLVSRRVRALLSRWPTDRVAMNYPLIVVGVGTVHGGALLAGGAVAFDGGVALVWYAVALDFAVPIVGWIAAVAHGWYHDDEVVRAAALPLAAGVVWYAVVTTGLFFLLFLALLFVGLPME